MTTFTNDEAAEWVGLQCRGDPRWAFAVMPGSDSRERWLVGYRCGLIFPMFRIDQCDYNSLEDGFEAFLDSPAWKTVEWLAGQGIAHDKSSLDEFNRASKRLS